MANDALIKANSRTTGRLRSAWRWYRERLPVVRIAIPFGLAFACIAGAWTVLNEGEYGVAIALVGLFLLFGIQAARETAWSREAKWAVSVVVILMAFYSGAVIVSKKGDKPWTSLSMYAKKKEIVKLPQPSVSPSSPLPSPSLVPSIQPSEFPPNPTPATPRLRTRRPKGPTDEEKWILRQLNSNKNAHANGDQKDGDITKEELKSVLARKLSKRGMKFLVAQVRKRGVSFPLTSDTERELRSFASEHGNNNIDSLILAVRENSAPVPPRVQTANEIYYDQFINYPSFLKTTVRHYVYFPPGEPPTQLLVRLVYRYQDHGPRTKTLVVFIPPVLGDWVLGETCRYVIKQAASWTEEIEKLEGIGNTEFTSASRFFTFNPALIIFHVTLMSDYRAKMLKREGHTIIGPIDPIIGP
jgi:hypothetical protein